MTAVKSLVSNAPVSEHGLQRLLAISLVRCFRIIPLRRIPKFRIFASQDITLHKGTPPPVNNNSTKNKKKSTDGFPTTQPNATDIDIGSAPHFVAVPIDRDEEPVKEFLSFTDDLISMVAWLKKCKITTVAMEATGVYWIPVYKILEQNGFEVKLVNARHLKNVSGRKTGVLDCQWIQRLHSCGLLDSSFRPSNQIVQLRGFIRQRSVLVEEASSKAQHTALGAFLRRLKARLGPAKAITATAHKMARQLYVMLKTKTAYAELGNKYYEERYRDRLIKNLKKRAEDFGFVLAPIQCETKIA